MTKEMTMKQVGINTLADQLMQLRGELSQENMAEKCAISLRQYSNLERRLASATAVTMLNLYAVGIDLNKWAEDTLSRYRQMNKD